MNRFAIIGKFYEPEPACFLATGDPSRSSGSERRVGKKQRARHNTVTVTAVTLLERYLNLIEIFARYATLWMLSGEVATAVFTRRILVTNLGLARGTGTTVVWVNPSHGFLSLFYG